MDSVTLERQNVIKLIAKKDKDMSNGMRDMSRTPLTESEIQYIKSEIKRIQADEYNHYIEMDGFMKEAVYGYTDEEKNIAYDVRRINYVSKESTKGNEADRDNNSEMPEVWDNTEDYNFIKR